MESCPDPSILKSQTAGDSDWYLFCTNEQFHDNGPLHLMAISRSNDLVHWKYVGDVFSQLPKVAPATGGLWAPDPEYFNGRYYLYFTIFDTRRFDTKQGGSAAGAGSAIYVATSSSLAGPWTVQTGPVVEPEAATCCGGGPRWTIDPNVVEDNGRRYIFFGSFYGGIFARELTAGGLGTVASSEVQIAVDNRYEAPYVVKHDGYFYLLASAGNCCAGALTGYGVFAARSANVLGPYTDMAGHTLLEARVGGTPVLATNGNRWIGPGGNALFTDANGQDWIVYHAVDANKPYFAGNVTTRRPVLMDPLDWIDGWPTVRGGAGPSDTILPAPAVVAGVSAPAAALLPPDVPGTLIARLSDNFGGAGLSQQWHWLGAAPSGGLQLDASSVGFPTQPGDIYKGSSNAALLAEDAPSGDYLVEVKLSTTVPLRGAFDHAQGGVMIYKDEGNYIKLGETSISQTRQVEFAKQVSAISSVPPVYGDTLVAAPGDSVWLRLVKRTGGGQELYTAYSSQDGSTWERGGTWTHALGTGTRIALYSMGHSGFVTQFDYVHVYALEN